MQVAAPGDVGDGQDGEAAREIEQDAEVAAIDAVDQHAADEGDDQAGQSYDDDLPAYGDGGVCGGHDVPAHADEVHAAAEERDEHGGEEEAEGALLREQFPIDTGCRRGGHQTF